jgi:hypothetical protein
MAGSGIVWIDGLRGSSVAPSQIGIHFRPAKKQSFPNFVRRGEQSAFDVLVDGADFEIETPGQSFLFAIVRPHLRFIPFQV